VIGGAELARQVNVLARFCGPRDELPGHADAVVLFGGSPLAGADVLARVAAIADRVIVVGGQGHTTAALRASFAAELGHVVPEDAAEADLHAAYLRERHGLHVELRERESTNCGTNVSLCLQLMRDHGIPAERLVLIQDATMQRRMDAGFRRHLGPRAAIHNLAAYQVDVVAVDGGLAYDRPVRGMWELPHYVSLLLGEIARLTDDEHGYGPRGRGFVAHVDVPAEVRAAFEVVRETATVRAADPRWG
jgi:uncharacterized SAM-binding protein YcdF (DUF218 family)